MDAIKCEIGMVVAGSVNNRYFQGTVENLLFALDSDCGLVPSAVVSLLPDTDDFVPGEQPIIVPVATLED